jgi:peptidoglycan/LPS O-acetylase OafA/YrhL
MPGFRRITSQKDFIPQIDGLRFVAITSVILFHLYGSLTHNGAVRVPVFDSQMIVLAKRGVELFFAISGFILGVPFASSYLRGGPSINLKRYFLRRLTRLEPPYVLNLLVWSAILMVVEHRRAHDIVPHLLASLAYLHGVIYNSDSTINGVAWSLEVEVQFYVLVPLLALIFAIRNPQIRRGTVLVLMLICSALGVIFMSLRAHVLIGFYIPFFLAGLLLSDLYVTKSEWKRSIAWDTAALCCWPFVWFLGPVSGHLLLPFIIIVLYLAAFRGCIFPAVFGNRIITNIGGMCYSLYLFHILVISSVGRISKPWHFGNSFWAYFLLQACLILPVVLTVCGAYFLLVERPCMDREWPKKIKNRLFASATISRLPLPRPHLDQSS